jgi:hypothetical protein
VSTPILSFSTETCKSWAISSIFYIF